MKVLEFQDGERTFACRAAGSPATPGIAWWWVTISGESQKYAAFQTQDGDTPQNLRPRILAYYAELIAGRERPREIRGNWGQRRAAQKPVETGGSDESKGKP